MPTREQLETALINADKAGDTQAATQLANAIRAGQFDEPQPQEGPLIGAARDVIGGAEALGTLATGAIAEPIAGVAGLVGAALPGEEGQGARFVEQTREALTYQPKTESGQAIVSGIAESAPIQALARGLSAAERASGDVGARVYEAAGLDPALGYAAYSALPAGLIELAGLGAPGKAGKQLARRAEGLEEVAGSQRAEIEALQADKPMRESVEAVAQEVQAGDAERITELAQFDPSVVKAASDLGFDEIPPSIAAGNAQFRDVAQGMASIAGSQAKAQYGQFLEQLATKADDLIEEGGGTLDKAALSARYFDETERVINDLSTQENALYRDIEAAVKPGQKVPVTGLRDYIDGKVAEFGSVGDMPKPLQDMHKLVYTPEGKIRIPTYAAFNQKRRELGQAIGTKSGPYGDAETGTLKDLYGAIKTQQRTIVDGAGVGDLQDAADALTIKRNAIQDTKVDILGRDLSKDLMPQVAAKITGLPKGNVTKFKELIDGVPENLRQEVVVSALNDLMRGTGADQRGMGAARFVGFMNDLNRSPTAKSALYKYLPKKTQRSLDNLNKVATGVYKANKESITTGKIAQFFPENQTFIGRLMGAGKRLLTDVTPGGRVASEAVEAATEGVSEFLSNSTTSAKAANELLASPQLQELMKRAVRDGVTEGGLITDKTKNLEKVIVRSKAYKKWADTLSGSQLARLSSLGLSSYLLSPEESNEENQSSEGPIEVAQ